MVICGVVFDIDDTLYFEREFVRSGFAHVAALAGRSESETRAVGEWLEDAFDAGVRADTFDRLLAAFPDLSARVSTSNLVDAYRAHLPAIGLAPGVESTLNGLRARGLRLGVLSDGPLASQAAKAAALGLNRWFEPILLTASLGPHATKPSTVGFEAIAREWGIPHAELSYVADNPEKDFAGPRRLGWLTIRIRQPEQLRFAVEAPADEYRAAVEVGTLAALPGCLGLEVPG